MGIRNTVAEAREKDGRTFAPKFLSKVIKNPGTYRVRLYPNLHSTDGFQGLVTAWYWPQKGQKGVRRKLADGSPEALKRQAVVDMLIAAGRIEGDGGANSHAASPEFWFNCVLTDQPGLPRILDLRSEFQFKKLAVAVANMSGIGVWTEYEASDDFEAAFDEGWKKAEGPSGMDIIILTKGAKDENGKSVAPRDKYTMRPSMKDNAVLPLALDAGFDLNAAALEEDGQGEKF